MKYPCIDCIVKACCQYYCPKVCKYINRTVYEHRKNNYIPQHKEVPTEIINFIKYLLKQKSRFQNKGYLSYTDNIMIKRKSGFIIRQ